LLERESRFAGYILVYGRMLHTRRLGLILLITPACACLKCAIAPLSESAERSHFDQQIE